MIIGDFAESLMRGVMLVGDMVLITPGCTYGSQAEFPRANSKMPSVN